MTIYKILILKILHIDYRPHFVVGWYLYQVLYCSSLACFVALGDLINIQPVASALFCEEEHRVMARGLKKVFDIILLTCSSADGSAATTALLAVFRGRRSFYVSQV